ncbi:hypothetical protein N7530_009390 [Penicillium desertorum]|uniref:Uncharacterized protein n=1 Tax=Penicillium desertorum TaxID=1303715 RepID=A0A9W9WIE4_9EURO|nr:hypothetical protein N7530_009390 [Penicillium desertorum]
MAAVTRWYGLYYDVWLGGQYFLKVEELHKQYGPIVRIKPNEVHCNDPEFVEVLFTGPLRKRDKDPWLPRAMAVPLAAGGTISHDLHRSRRTPLGPYFSKKSVRKQEVILQDTLEKLLRRFEEHRNTGTVVTLNEAFAAAAADIVTTFSFGKSTNSVEKKDFNGPFFQAMDASFRLSHITANFGWVRAFLRSPPPQIVTWITPTLAPLFELHQQWKGQIRDAKAPSEKQVTTIFDQIMGAKLSPLERRFKRLHQEAELIFLAGFSTTAATSSMLTFELLANPDKMNKLRVELLQALPHTDSPLSLSELEKLPYLSAVIQEGIRLHPGGALRMQRISPDKPLIYTDPRTGTTTTFPAGTSMSMDAPSINKNPELFPNPSEFVPERWLESPHLSRYLLTFSKGTRICLGINLAWGMLYYFIAGVFRNYGPPTGTDTSFPTIELYETERKKDVDTVAEFVIPVAEKESKGIRVLFR